MSDPDRCVRCLLPASLPSVQLDEEGVCNHCATYDSWFGDFERTRSQRKLEFAKLLQRAQRQRQPYDCLIPLSGGKDSTYALYLCSRVYKLKCLCVTFDNGYLSKFGRENIENALKATGADHITYRIDRDLLLRLYALFTRRCGNFCPICNRGIEVAIRMAAQAFRVPLVIGGNGLKPTYLSDGLMPELQQGGDARFVRNVLRGDPLEKAAAALLSYPRPHNALDRVACAVAAVIPFRPLKRAFWAVHARVRNLLSWLKIERSVTPRYINFQDYIDVPYPELRQTLEQEMGWRAPVDKFEHVDCLIEPVKVHIQTLKFPELSREIVKNSGRVRSGQMTREDALEIERELLGDGWVPPTLELLLRDIAVTEEEFREAARDWRVMDSFRAERAFPEAAIEATNDAALGE